ncbi:MAG: glycosyltransferase family 4 protein [Longimicrobiales bacterium]
MSEGHPLRILVVNWLDGKNPQAGGAETHLHEVFGRLAKKGHQVTVLCSGWSGAPTREVVDGLEVLRSGTRYSFSLTAPARYRKELAGRDFDIVVEDLNKVPLFTRYWARGRRHVALVHHLFGSTAFQEAGPVLAGATWLMERPLPRVLRGIPCIAVSESTKSDLIQRGLNGDLITVIPNGVDLGRNSEPKAPTFTVLYVGRLKRYKRVDLLLRAVASLIKRGADVDALIVGRGDDRPRLEKLARRLELGGALTFAGFVSEAEKRRLFARAWVHVYSSPKEGWGISNLEAAAAGTASVSSDSPGLRETVIDGVTGFLVEHGNVDQLADRVALLADPETRDKMGSAARSFAEGYAWERVSDAFEAEFRRLLANDHEP